MFSALHFKKCRVFHILDKSNQTGYNNVSTYSTAFGDWVVSLYPKYITKLKKGKHIHIPDNSTGIFDDIFNKIEQENIN